MSEILAEVNVDETEIVRLKPGQTAKVTADAVEKTTYEGRVTEIGNTAKRQGEVNVFGVKILLTAPDERLRPGMTAKAKIEVERQRDVLLVPIQAVTVRERKQLDEERKAAGKSKGAEAGAAKDGKGATEKVAAGKGEAAKSEAAGGAEAPGATQAAKVEGGASGGAAASEAAGKGDAAKGEAAGGPAGASSPEPARADAAKGEGGAGGASGGAGAKPGDEREELEVVYVIDKDLVHAAQVKTGASDETYVEIKDGLKEGENVVKGPYRILRRLKVGDRVVVKDEREAADEAEKSNGGSQSGGGRD
jgi:putative transposon-encoded protein